MLGFVTFAVMSVCPIQHSLQEWELWFTQEWGVQSIVEL